MLWCAGFSVGFKRRRRLRAQGSGQREMCLYSASKGVQGYFRCLRAVPFPPNGKGREGLIDSLGTSPCLSCTHHRLTPTLLFSSSMAQTETLQIGARRARPGRIVLLFAAVLGVETPLNDTSDVVRMPAWFHPFCCSLVPIWPDQLERASREVLSVQEGWRCCV